MFCPGDPVILREVTVDGVWTARPVTVVRDAPDLIVLWMAPGTIYKHPRELDNDRIPELFAAPWRLVDVEWHGSGCLYVSEPDSWHVVMYFWSDDHTIFDHWYVNLQTPYKRTPLGFDYLDQELDLVIRPDRSWSVKDEDRFESAIARGVIDRPHATRVRQEVDRVVASLDDPTSVFNQGWERWTPPGEFAVPALPAGWDEVATS